MIDLRTLNITIRNGVAVEMNVELEDLKWQVRKLSKDEQFAVTPFQRSFRVNSMNFPNALGFLGHAASFWSNYNTGKMRHRTSQSRAFRFFELCKTVNSRFHITCIPSTTCLQTVTTQTVACRTPRFLPSIESLRCLLLPVRLDLTVHLDILIYYSAVAQAVSRELTLLII
jgi:hypothetical protein